jgi:hypothetical protein
MLIELPLFAEACSSREQQHAAPAQVTTLAASSCRNLMTVASIYAIYVTEATQPFYIACVA